jgi:type VI secretion system protein ImpI
MVRSAERTMIQARDNNALKFSPTPEAALANIFGPPTSGYLDMWQTFERGFSDILAHEEATFAAMQQALQDLLSDLSPEAITGEDGTAKRSFLGGSKSRHWETFVEHWTAKAAAGDNGMLDAFLDLFAAYYDEISSNRRQ